MHIPDFHGPLTPTARDRSLALAREFFALHFPQERPAAVLCHSWLLDPQLRRYLPAHSRIVRFQGTVPRRVRADRARRTPSPFGPSSGTRTCRWTSCPRRTSVERAVGDHLRAGGHWYIGHGWFPFRGRIARTSELGEVGNGCAGAGRCPGMRIEMRDGYEGTGPGAITPDGCAVELYARLPVGDEPDIIAAAVPAGAHILELGSGVGRVTHPRRWSAASR